MKADEIHSRIPLPYEQFPPIASDAGWFHGSRSERRLDQDGLTKLAQVRDIRRLDPLRGYNEARQDKTYDCGPFLIAWHAIVSFDCKICQVYLRSALHHQETDRRF